MTDLTRIVLDHPFSSLAEEYKQIAFALSMEAETHRSQIYTCFSAGAGQGSTSLTINALNAFRAREDKKILIDLNIWRPLERPGLPKRTQGLWDVVEGKASIDDVIIKDIEYPFHLLPYGQWQESNKNIFQEIGLDTIIQNLREKYDVIMIDSPPFSLTTDARFLARLADVSILVVKAEAVGEKELFRVVSLLDKSEIEVISIVLNQTKLFKGKYYKAAMQKHHAFISGAQKQVNDESA